MKNIILIIYLLCASLSEGWAQMYIGKDKSTIISFYSDAPLEKIEAKNVTSTPVFNVSTGDFQIRISMQSFQFKNDLMKEHFNENYVESEKYPYCTFKGKCDVTNFEEGKEYDATMTGKIELHGVSKEIVVKGKIKKQNGELIMFSEFMLKPADYEIKVPKLLTEKIAEEVKVTFSSTLVPYVKK